MHRSEGAAEDENPQMNTEETLEQHFPTPVLLRSHTGIDELTNGLLRVMETAGQTKPPVSATTPP